MKLLWLDDTRNPHEDDWLVFSPIPRNEISEVIWLKSYQEFIEWIEENGLPNGICFDHDLSDFQAFYSGYPELMEDIPYPESEKTGYDCAKWLTEYCMNHKELLPPFNIQSANPAGKINIQSYLDNYKRVIENT